MKRVSVRNLTAAAKLARDLFHPSGALLHAAGEALTREHLRLLEENGIELVVEVDSPAEAEELKRRGPYATRYVHDLREGEVFATPLLNDQLVVLLPAHTEITPEVRDRVARRSAFVLVRQTAEESGALRATAYLARKREIAAARFGQRRDARARKTPTPAPTASPPLPEKAAEAADRRRHPRTATEFSARARLRRRGADSGHDAEIVVRVLDVSCSGFRIETLALLADGDRLLVRIAPRSRRVVIRGVLEVVWALPRAGRTVAGLRFLFAEAERREDKEEVTGT